MKHIKKATAAVLLLAGIGLAGPGLGQTAPAAAATGNARTAVPQPGAGRVLVMDAQVHHHRRHYPHRVYAAPPPPPNYGYSPYTDWTTRCMEDLGYGRRGMYGCGGGR